jgi:hypothetical protein
MSSIHVDHVLSRPDTRGALRAWMLAHVPRGAGIVVEPVIPHAWLYDDTGQPLWRAWNTLRADVDDAGRPLRRARYVKVDRYERTLRPALLDRYAARGYCWVAIASTQFGRALAQPREVPRAIAYYHALARGSGRLVALFSPYRSGARPPTFNFDWSFDYEPGIYARPGPQIAVFRLIGCRPRPA